MPIIVSCTVSPSTKVAQRNQNLALLVPERYGLTEEPTKGETGHLPREYRPVTTSKDTNLIIDLINSFIVNLIVRYSA